MFLLRTEARKSTKERNDKMRINKSKFRLALTSLMLLVLLFSVFAAVLVEASPGGTAYVDDDDATCGGNSPCFSKNQDAINDATLFDTIIVRPGTYVENLTITRSLVLTTSSGFLARDTIIDGGLAGRVIDVRGTESTPIAVTVEGFVIKNGLAAYGAMPGDPLDGSGAGIGAFYATMIIRGNQIKDNGFTPGYPCLPATLWGGGISLDSGSGSVIEANFIEGNNAADYTVGGLCDWDAWGWGGGIAIILSDNVVMVNNFITDNWTVYDGAGILIETANVKVIHNTIRRNAVDTYWTWDGGMCIESGDGSVVDVVNTICWNDAYGPDGYDREFHLWNGGTMTATYSNIRDGSCPGGPCTGNVSIDPNFVSYFDSHLNVTSPLIDIAVASTVTDDIDGDTRPQGAVPDIGADEVLPPEGEVDIDIKPGSDPNCFNHNKHGVIPVAIFGSADLDVEDINLDSLLLQGLSVRVVGKNDKYLAHYEYVNDDDYLDFIVQFEDSGGWITSGDGYAMLSGELNDRTPIEGKDTICIVP